LLGNIQFEVIKFLSLVKIRQEEAADSVEKQRQAEEAKVVRKQVHATEPVPVNVAGNPPPAQPPKAPQTPVTRPPKVGRNDPCPCGSGKKFKECHGRLV
jgi:preprotein translocase subunit SecA